MSLRKKIGLSDLKLAIVAPLSQVEGWYRCKKNLIKVDIMHMSYNTSDIGVSIRVHVYYFQTL